jgi:hypothetical protein
MSRTRKKSHGDAVDRLAARYQQARLHARWMHRCAALAVATCDPADATAALERFHAAAAWEERTRRRYERAVLLEYAWWTHGTEGAHRVPGTLGAGDATPVDAPAPSPATAA